MALTGTLAWRSRDPISGRAHDHDSDDVVEGFSFAIAWEFSGISFWVRCRCCRCHVDLLLKPKTDEFGLTAVEKCLEPRIVSEIVKLDPGTKFCFRKSFLDRFLQPVECCRPVAEMVVDDGAKQQLVRIA
jgi:hypothetical protein